MSTFPDGSFTQTAFVVKDVERTAKRWTALTGAGPWFILEPETRNTIYRGSPSNAKYRLGMAFVGASLIELIQPTDDQPSILNEVLAERGEGFHHVAPRLTGLRGPTFDARCRELEAAGLQLAMSNEVVGLGRASFYDAKEQTGGFIEVFELGSGYAMVPLMANLHRDWDKSDPIRPLETLFGKF